MRVSKLKELLKHVNDDAEVIIHAPVGIYHGVDDGSILNNDKVVLEIKVRNYQD